MTKTFFDIDALFQQLRASNEGLNVTAAAALIELKGQIDLANQMATSYRQHLVVANQRIAAYQTRLEVDHYWQPNSETGELERVEVPEAERDERIPDFDGIACRDATIAFLNAQVESLAARLDAAQHNDSERITAAAIRINGVICQVPSPGRHHTIIHALAEAGHPTPVGVGEHSEQGFVTSRGRFVDRETAARVAVEAGQLPAGYEFKGGGQMFSEDLW